MNNRTRRTKGTGTGNPDREAGQAESAYALGATGACNTGGGIALMEQVEERLSLGVLGLFHFNRRARLLPLEGGGV